MKRSEARNIIYRLLVEPDENTTDENCDRIIDALGVIVEPDDTSLPPRLNVQWQSNPTIPAGSARLANNDWEINVQWGLGFEDSVRLARALVDAYNKRNDREGVGSTWRTGDPPSPGEYLIKRDNGYKTTAWYDAPSDCPKSSWWCDGKPVVGNVVGWQPLPE